MQMLRTRDKVLAQVLFWQDPCAAVGPEAQLQATNFDTILTLQALACHEAVEYIIYISILM